MLFINAIDAVVAQLPESHWLFQNILEKRAFLAGRWPNHVYFSPGILKTRYEYRQD